VCAGCEDVSIRRLRVVIASRQWVSAHVVGSLPKAMWHSFSCVVIQLLLSGERRWLSHEASLLARGKRHTAARVIFDKRLSSAIRGSDSSCATRAMGVDDR
jgi:hypothetical protein